MSNTLDNKTWILYYKEGLIIVNLLYGVIIGLTVYSFISTITICITNEDEDVIMYFALGICGLILNCTCWCISKVIHWHKYHDKRSIIINKETMERKWCKLKDADDIIGWHEGYNFIKRYSDKSEWNKLESFSDEFIEWSKQNCDNCKYDKECGKGNYNIKCKHDIYDSVLEYDAFEFK